MPKKTIFWMLVLIIMLVLSGCNITRRSNCEQSGGIWVVEGGGITGVGFIGCRCPQTIDKNGVCMTFEEAGCNQRNGVWVCPTQV